MERLYVFLIRNDVWIYIICGLGLIWYSTEFLRARRMLRSAMFGLEKERGQRLQRRSLTFMAIFVIIVVGVTYVNREVAPTLPADLLKPPTPTPNIFATPLSSPTPIGGPPEATSSPVIAPTVTLPASDEVGPRSSDPINGEDELATPDIVDVIPTVEVVGCSAPINITSPANGLSVSGEIIFFGSVELEDLGSYEMEANGPQTGGAWLSIQSDPGQDPVSDGTLNMANLSNWLPGSYSIRLNVFDEEDLLIGQCSVDILLQAPTS